MNTETTTMTKEEHATWLEEMKYWSNELNFYEKVLLRLIEFPNMDEQAGHLEEFENRFIDMRSRLAELGSHLNDTSVDGVVRSSINAIETDFRKLKNDFYLFSDKIDK